MTPPPPGVSVLLARTPLFEALPAEIIEEAAASMHEVRLDGGQVLFSRGDIGDAIYLVLDGRVRLSIQTWEGRELSFRHAVQGQIFGEIAVLDASPRTADAIALVPTRLLSLPAAAAPRRQRPDRGHRASADRGPPRQIYPRTTAAEGAGGRGAADGEDRSRHIAERARPADRRQST
jgi:hypothetical protein